MTGQTFSLPEQPPHGSGYRERDKMLTLNVDPDELIKAIREIVDEDPFFVYRRPRKTNGSSGGCYYEHSGKPSCLIGRGLFKLGVSIETLAQMDRIRPYASNGTAITSYFPNVEDIRVRWLMVVQEQQDAEYEYNYCIDHADRCFPSLAS